MTEKPSQVATFQLDGAMVVTKITDETPAKPSPKPKAVRASRSPCMKNSAATPRPVTTTSGAVSMPTASVRPAHTPDRVAAGRQCGAFSKK